MSTVKPKYETEKSTGSTCTHPAQNTMQPRIVQLASYNGHTTGDTNYGPQTVMLSRLYSDDICLERKLLEKVRKNHTFHRNVPKFILSAQSIAANNDRRCHPPVDTSRHQQMLSRSSPYSTAHPPLAASKQATHMNSNQRLSVRLCSLH